MINYILITILFIFVFIFLVTGLGTNTTITRSGIELSGNWIYKETVDFLAKAYFHVIFGGFSLHFEDIGFFRVGDTIRVSNPAVRGTDRFCQIRYIADDFIVVTLIKDFS